MRSFDQLDWVHSFGDFEMVMYVLADGGEDDGIYMQVLSRNVTDGAEAWDILYDRRLTNVIGDVPLEPDHPSFEDEVLRNYLHEHPTLVDDEKEFLRNWLEQSREQGE
jgi:hypothetical protein